MQGNLGIQALKLDAKTEFHLGSLFRGSLGQCRAAAGWGDAGAASCTRHQEASWPPRAPCTLSSPALSQEWLSCYCSAAEWHQVGYSQQEKRHLSNRQEPTHAVILLHALPSLGKTLRQAALAQDIQCSGPRCGGTAPLPGEGAGPASSQVNIVPRSLALPGDAGVRNQTGRRVPAGTWGGSLVQPWSGSSTRAGLSKERAPKGGSVPAAWLLWHKPGTASWGAAGPATPNTCLPGCPRQLSQPCGTVTPILQAHKDVPAVLLLPESGALRQVTPRAKLLPALPAPRHRASSIGAEGPHSLWESLLLPFSGGFCCRQGRNSANAT